MLRSAVLLAGWYLLAVSWMVMAWLHSASHLLLEIGCICLGVVVRLIRTLFRPTDVSLLNWCLLGLTVTSIRPLYQGLS